MSLSSHHHRDEYGQRYQIFYYQAEQNHKLQIHSPNEKSSWKDEKIFLLVMQKFVIAHEYEEGEAQQEVDEEG